MFSHRRLLENGKGGTGKGLFVIIIIVCLFVFHQLTVLSCPVWQKSERMPWEEEGATVGRAEPKK